MGEQACLRASWRNLPEKQQPLRTRLCGLWCLCPSLALLPTSSPPCRCVQTVVTPAPSLCPPSHPLLPEDPLRGGQPPALFAHLGSHLLRFLPSHLRPQPRAASHLPRSGGSLGPAHPSAGVLTGSGQCRPWRQSEGSSVLCAHAAASPPGLPPGPHHAGLRYPPEACLARGLLSSLEATLSKSFSSTMTLPSLESSWLWSSSSLQPWGCTM